MQRASSRARTYYISTLSPARLPARAEAKLGESAKKMGNRGGVIESNSEQKRNFRKNI